MIQCAAATGEIHFELQVLTTKQRTDFPANSIFLVDAQRLVPQTPA